jgi:hypothetical protein
MGLGKTIQLAGLIKNQPRSSKQSTLVIAPVAVLEQWKAVFKRAALRVWVPKPRHYTWELESKSKDILAHNVHVIGYEAAQRNPSLVKLFKWTRIIYDEAHRLGSNNTSTELALTFKERVKNIWLLTGTPIVNKVKDISTLFNVAGIDTPGGYDLETLAPVMKKYIMARSMDQLRDQISDAPPKPAFETLHLDFNTEEEREFYNGMTGIICKRWKALDEDSGGPTGLALLESYDLDNLTTMQSRLVNLSSRGLVGTDQNIIIPGITTGGTSARLWTLGAGAGAAAESGEAGAAADSGDGAGIILHQADAGIQPRLDLGDAGQAIIEQFAG